MRRYEDVVLSQSGAPVKGANVQVNIAGTTTPAPLFSDDGLTPLTNPVITDTLGRFAFYVATGKYDLIASGGGISVIYTQQNVSIDELTDANPLDLPWETEQIQFSNLQVAPSTPPAGLTVLYSKNTDNNLYYQSSSGVEVGPLGMTGVHDINGLQGSVGLAAGANVAITPSGNSLVISSSGGGGGGNGVQSLNSLTGNLGIVAGGNVSVTNSGTNIQISASPGSTDLYLDVTEFGAKTVLPFNPPNTTASCTAGSTTVTLANGSVFTNGEGIALYDCGAPNVLAAPGTPTVTPSYASTLTNVGDVVSAPAGTTSYSYQIVARSKNGAMSPPSAIGTTSTGGTLGNITLNVSTLTRSSNVVTVTLASSFPLAVGQTVYLQNSSSSTFSGLYIISSVTNNTTFSYIQGLSANGNPAPPTNSATGGTASFYSCNFLSWPAVAGAWQYYIYGAQGAGTISYIGTTIPGFTSFEDYGLPSDTTPSPRPLWVPTTPNPLGAPGHLGAVIVSGGGGNTITINTPALSNTTNVYCQHDDTPAIIAAFTAAQGANQHNTIHFPNSPGPGGNVVNSAYLISTFCDLTAHSFGASVVQSMAIWCDDTIQLNDEMTWDGDIGGGSVSGVPQFGWNSGQTIQGNGANPVIYQGFSNGANSWRRVSMSTNPNGVILVIGGFGGGFFNNIEYSNFVINTPNGKADYYGMCLVGLGITQSFLRNSNMLTTTAFPGGKPYGYSLTPIFPNIPPPGNPGAGGFLAINLSMNGRGAFMKSPNLDANQEFILLHCYGQALGSPYLTLGNINEANVIITSITNDTSPVALVANLNPFGFLGPNVIINGPVNISAETGGGPTNGFPGVLTGMPATSIFTAGMDLSANPAGVLLGQNIGAVVVGARFNGGNLSVSNTLTASTIAPTVIQPTALTLAQWGSQANGTIGYCSDCTIANPCAGGGTGAIIKFLNGVKVCN